jgi:NAD(P)-dependent dehydrogenase (short-subunit alcohol dehydrogenase family)
MLSDQVVLVTGSGRGIGAAAALAFAQRGCRVVISSRTASELAEVKNQILLAVPDAKIFIHTADVSDVKSILNLFEAIENTWGPVEILINNAAVGYKMDFFSVTESTWDQTMDINVKGTFFCTQEMMKRFKRRNTPGLVINISSLGGLQKTEKFKGLTPYVASKFAVVGLTEALAVEGHDLGILVNAVAPGAVETEMLRKAAPHLKTQTKPGDVAQVILSLCEDALAQGLTAQVVEIHSNL